MDVIYIDNIRHQVIESDGGGIFVDHPEMRGRKCAYHRIDKASQLWIERGSAIKTNGKFYASRETVVSES